MPLIEFTRLGVDKLLHVRIGQVVTERTCLMQFPGVLGFRFHEKECITPELFPAPVSARTLRAVRMLCHHERGSFLA